MSHLHYQGRDKMALYSNNEHSSSTDDPNRSTVLSPPFQLNSTMLSNRNVTQLNSPQQIHPNGIKTFQIKGQHIQNITHLDQQLNNTHNNSQSGVNLNKLNTLTNTAKSNVSQIHHQPQTSAASTNEQSISEMRSCFSDPQHFFSSNHFSGSSTSENSRPIQRNNNHKQIFHSSENQSQEEKLHLLQQNKESILHKMSRKDIQSHQFSVTNTEEESSSNFPYSSEPCLQIEGTLNQFCIHHPKKKVKFDTSTLIADKDTQVKYFMVDHPQERFCSSCAITFAKQGFQIQEIPKKQNKEVNDFMEEMKTVKQLNDLLMNSFEEKLKYIKKHGSFYSQQLNLFFFEVEKNMSALKMDLLSEINKHMWEAINALESKRNEAKIFEKRLLRNQIEIEKNRNQIIDEMDASEISQILKHYTQELAATKSSLQDISTSTCFSLISIDQSKLQKGNLLKYITNDIINKSSININLIEDSLNEVFNDFTKELSTPQQQSPLQHQMSKLMTNSFKIQDKSRLLQTPGVKNHSQFQIASVEKSALKARSGPSEQLSSKKHLFIGDASKKFIAIEILPQKKTLKEEQERDESQEDERQKQPLKLNLSSPNQKQFSKETLQTQITSKTTASSEERGKPKVKDLKSQINLAYLQKIISENQSKKQQSQQQQQQLHQSQSIYFENGESNKKPGSLQVAIEAIDTSVSEKQQTQESDDLSLYQGNQNGLNYNKIQNKNNITSNKIISYSDIHDEPISNLHLIKHSPMLSTQPLFASPSSPSNQNDINQQQPNLIYFQNTPSLSAKNKYSNVQTEPSHLGSSKFAKINKQQQENQSYKRNLIMSDEALASNKQFKLTTPNVLQELDMNRQRYYQPKNDCTIQQQEECKNKNQMNSHIKSNHQNTNNSSHHSSQNNLKHFFNKEN